jgi:glycosyl transferase family 25
MFDKIFVINMKKDEQRLDNFNKLSKKLNFEYNIKEAVIGKNLKKLPKYIKENHNLGPSEVGCFMSHVEIWEELLLSNDNSYLIFEDDVDTYIDAEKFNELKNSKVDFDILYLGKCLCNCGSLEPLESKNLFKAKAPVCLHAYIITKNFVKIALENFPTSKTIDSYIQQLNLDVKVYHPSLFYQDIFSNNSNLRNKFATYNINNECKTDLTSLMSDNTTSTVGFILVFIIFLFIAMLIITF